MQRTAKPGSQAASYRIVIIVGVVILLLALAYFYFSRDEDVEPLPPTAAVQPEPAAPAEPEGTPLVRHPLPEEDDAADGDEIAKLVPKPLPKLDASDDLMMRLGRHLLDQPELFDLMVPKELIRRIVITVDNLPRRAIPQKTSPFTPPAGSFLSTGNADSLSIDPKNYARYDRHVALINQLDSGELVTAYLRIYPLLQAAYNELGYPNVYFNDRVMLAIEDLLATPTLSEPPSLVQSQVYSQYARPELEELSAGQKLLLRMGPEHAASLKEKLEEIRVELRKR